MRQKLKVWLQKVCWVEEKGIALVRRFGNPKSDERIGPSIVLLGS